NDIDGRWLGSNRSAVAEKFALFNDVGDFSWNPLLPSAVSGLQLRQHVGRMNPQILVMIISDLLNVLIVGQIPKQRAQIGSDLDLSCRDDLSAGFINHRINVQF